MAARQFVFTLVLIALASFLQMAIANDSQPRDGPLIAVRRAKITLLTGQTTYAEKGAVVSKQSTEVQGHFGVLVQSTQLVDPDALGDDYVAGWMAKGDLIRANTAIREFNSAISESPMDLIALVGRGNAYLSLQRFDEAIADYQRAVELAPENPMPLLNYSEALRRVGRFEEAVSASSKAIDVSPKLVPAYLSRARARGDMGRYPEAIDDCTAAIMLNPEGSSGYCGRGFWRCVNNEMNLAMTDFHLWNDAKKRAAGRNPFATLPEMPKAVFELKFGEEPQTRTSFTDADSAAVDRVIPSYREVWLLAGILSERSGSNGKAIDFLNLAYLCKLPLPAEFRVLYHRALAKAAARKSDEAIVDFNRAIKLISGHPEIGALMPTNTLQGHLACCRAARSANSNKLDEALAEAEEAIRLDPLLTEGYVTRGGIRVRRNELDKALPDIEKAISEVDCDSRCRTLALYLRAQIEFRRDDFTAAITDLNEAIRLQPPVIDSWLLRAQCLTRVDDYDKSIADCDHIIAVKPDSAEAYYLRADNFRLQNDLERSLQDCDKLIALQPRNKHGPFLRSMVFMGLNQPSKAIEDLERVVELDPNYADGYRSIAWVQATCPDASVRNGTSAVANGRKACELTEWKDDQFVATLSAAHAEAGEYEEAKKVLRKAMEMAPSKNVELRKKVMAAFERGEPYRDEIVPVKD